MPTGPAGWGSALFPPINQARLPTARPPACPTPRHHIHGQQTYARTHAEAFALLLLPGRGVRVGVLVLLVGPQAPPFGRLDQLQGQGPHHERECQRSPPTTPTTIPRCRPRPRHQCCSIGPGQTPQSAGRLKCPCDVSIKLSRGLVWELAPLARSDAFVVTGAFDCSLNLAKATTTKLRLPHTPPATATPSRQPRGVRMCCVIGCAGRLGPGRWVFITAPWPPTCRALLSDNRPLEHHVSPQRREAPSPVDTCGRPSADRTAHTSSSE